MSTQMTTTNTTTNVSLILQALLQLRYGQEAILTIDEIDTIGNNGGGGACTLDPYEMDDCDGLATFDSTNNIGRSTRNTLVCNRWLWRDAIIPYNNQLSSTDIIDRLELAMRHIENISCVRFRPIVDGVDHKFITIIQSADDVRQRCRANAGAILRNPQLELAIDCSSGQVMHELFHVLGFAHEHQRPDRDQFIRVQCANIIPNMSINFRRLKSNVVQNFDTDYDFYSIMHYPLEHFSINGRPTLEPLIIDGINRSMIGSSTQPTSIDIYRLNKLYRCETMNNSIIEF